jgi:serine/threonine protein kinase/beta-lactam-binding protein with PASTA domain
MADTSIQPGSTINNRYVIRRTLGSSNGAIVFEAEDTSLQRSVAVRILTTEVLVNEEWRQYFRHEVTAVAALHHPNLTRIYDWGEIDGTIYVVSEYLAGGSLRDVLAARGRLSPEQTALIGLESATALAYAHARQFVHGAIRPSKILFDDEGRVRINDLGLAAALQASPGATGSLEQARYVSPEQVLGSPVEARSDVYSLSLVLFECLTGHTPFDGLSIENIRTNRVGAPLPHRPELGPFDLILALGAAPDPAARPDADLFANRLTAVASTLPVPRPVTLNAGNLGGFVAPSPADVLTAPAIAVAGRTPLVDHVGGDVVRPFDRPGYRENFATARRNGPPQPPRRGGRQALALLLTVVVMILLIGLGVAWKVGAFTTSFKVPSLEGLSQTAAAKLISHDGFLLSIAGNTHSSSVPEAFIVSQRPSAHASLNQGGVIHVVVSDGPASVTVPQLINLGCNAAIAKLVQAGLTGSCPESLQTFNATAPAGAVVAVDFGSKVNPTSVPVRSNLLLVLSKGVATTTTTTTTVPSTTTTTTTPAHAATVVPNLVGKDSAQTESLMHNAGLYYVTYGPGSQNGTWTTVVSTSPKGGTTVPWHSYVHVNVT